MQTTPAIASLQEPCPASTGANWRGRELGDHGMTQVTRRQALALGGSAFLSELMMTGGGARAAGKDTLTIAFNVNLPSFDPTVGPSAVNPTIQAIYRSVFDQ
jgi:hypothetical protein